MFMSDFCVYVERERWREEEKAGKECVRAGACRAWGRNRKMGKITWIINIYQ